MRLHRFRRRRWRVRTGALLALLLLVMAAQATVHDSTKPAAARRTTPTPPATPTSPSATATVAAVPTALGAQLWVWSCTDSAALVQRARQASITTLLIWVSPGFSANAVTTARLTALVSAARTAGLETVALGGDASWAVHPDVAGAWGREVAASGLFSGLHVDIEPHALADWTKDQTQLSQGLLSALDELRPSTQTLQADIPAWYGTVEVNGEPLDQAVLERVDGVTVMAYRNTAAAVLKAAKPELAAAGRVGKPAYIGINIAAPGPDGGLTSFLGQTPAKIQTAVDAITLTARTWPGYAGLAVHDSDYLLRLSPAKPLTF